jgi:hypothetical protein
VCGREPGKQPPQLIDRAALVAIYDEATVLTAIRALPERHGLGVPAAATGLARIAFIDDFQGFPSEETFVLQHLHEAIEPLIVEDAAMEGLEMQGRVPS